MTVKEMYNEIHTAIQFASEGRAPQVEQRFHKHNQYVSYGLKTPVFRDLMKNIRGRVMRLSLDDRLLLARQLFESHLGELADAGIFILGYSVNELTPHHFKKMDRMMDHYRSWSQVDAMCLYVLQPLLAAYPEDTLKQLEVWNGSENRWKRRTSVVVFVRKVGKTAQYTDDGLRLCEKLIWDTEDIVLKGVGWALKDMLKGDRERVLDYVKELRRRGVSSVITLYAIRDIKGAERNAILDIEKQ